MKNVGVEAERYIVFEFHGERDKDGRAPFQGQPTADDIDSFTRELDAIHRERNALLEENQNLGAASAVAQAQLHMITNSRSWRYLRPARAVFSFIRNRVLRLN